MPSSTIGCAEASISRAAAAIAASGRGAEQRHAHGGQHAIGRGTGHDVVGQADVGGTAAPGFRRPEGLRDDFPDSVGGFDFGRKSRDGPKDADGIEVLMALLGQVRPRHAAAETHHGHPFGICGGKASHEIGCPGPGGDDADSGLSGHFADAGSDEGGVLLVAADDRLDARSEQGVEDAIDLGARDAAHAGDALRLEVFDKNVRAAWISHSEPLIWLQSALLAGWMLVDRPGKGGWRGSGRQTRAGVHDVYFAEISDIRRGQADIDRSNRAG